MWAPPGPPRAASLACAWTLAELRPQPFPLQHPLWCPVGVAALSTARLVTGSGLGCPARLWWRQPSRGGSIVGGGAGAGPGTAEGGAEGPLCQPEQRVCWVHRRLVLRQRLGGRSRGLWLEQRPHRARPIGKGHMLAFREDTTGRAGCGSCPQSANRRSPHVSAPAILCDLGPASCSTSLSLQR